MAYDLTDWYWAAPDDAKHVFSSKRAEIVPLDDSDFLLWLEDETHILGRMTDWFTIYNLLIPVMTPKLYAAIIPHLTPSQLFGIKLLLGLTVTFTSHPDLSGTYALDQSSQFSIMGVVVGINAGTGFPLGQPTLTWMDTTGHPHVFSTPELFTSLAVAMRNYIAALNYTWGVLESGGSAPWPPSTVTIP